MNWQRPERIPVGVGILPAAWMKYRDALDAVIARHPLLFGEQRHSKRDYDAVWSGTYVQGEHIDAWGCVWTNVHTGMESIVKGHPVRTREAVRTLSAPDRDAGLPHGFMWLRLADLRGFEEIMLDFAEEPPELQMLIDTVLGYNLRQARLQLWEMKESGQFVYFGDDLGTQHALPISPAKWRRYLKPCYAAIYRLYRQAGQYVYMHTDGHCWEVIPDLVECGVQVINPQVGANGLENLARVCRGRVCVDLDLDRQHFPFWTPREIDEHVRQAVEALGAPEGGLWLKAELGEDVPLENIEAILSALERHGGYHA